MSDRLKTVLLAALPAAALGGAVTYFALTRQSQAELQVREQQHGAEMAKLRGVSEAAQAQVDSLREQLQAAGVPILQTAPSVPRQNDPERLEAVRQLSAVQKHVTELTAANRDLQARAVELQAAVEKLNSENRRMSGEAEELKESLEKTRRVVAATEAELKSKTDRVVQMEASLARSREENAGALAQLRSTGGVLREFEELNRRRENTLTNLQRRYRELTDLYRSTLLAIEQQRDNPAIRQLPDASRIQSTVLAAEDDLRQINALNTQAQRLAQRLQPSR